MFCPEQLSKKKKQLHRDYKGRGKKPVIRRQLQVISEQWAGETYSSYQHRAKQLQFSQDSGVAPSTHMVAPNHLLLQLQGVEPLLVSLWGHCLPMVHNHTCRQNTHTPTPPKPNMRPTTVKLAQQTIKSFSLLDLTVVLYQRHRQQYKTNKQTKPTAFHMMRTFWVANIHYQNNKRQL